MSKVFSPSTKVSKQFFPQISRNITAIFNQINFQPILFSLMMILIVANTFSWFFIKQTSEKQLRLQVMADPYSSFPHQQLGQYYVEKNALEAKREFLLSQEFFYPPLLLSSDTLGDQSSPMQTWENIEKERENIKKQIVYWSEVQTKNPNYIYAKLKQAIYYHSLGDNDASKRILKSVLYDNPNNESAGQLLRQLSLP